MNYSKPTLLVISGPNGAGKSTHIQTMLPEAFDGIVSFDRDRYRTNFEQQLADEGVNAEMLTPEATRLMEKELLNFMKIAIANKEHFVLETPLSHPDYWAYLDLFEKNGYQIQLNYLCLDKVADCIARVGQRVLEGGHYVSPDTIAGVYDRNLAHINLYKDTFACIELYDGMTFPKMLARLENHIVTYADKSALKKRWIRDGIPTIAANIKAFNERKKTKGA
ncbi:zeta toxin family protein [Dyadobacter sp. MSC1_007]|jgi:predicted ABC-type ATPase|uniref:zeta toxin family protein n=1 Tax=Dyadobacter sp. MSC1_007 TaxID=2909264 RepID=UPI00202EB6E2|nr:zeta toxin family protein [Dyadobacter sp. MSC1_007]